MLKNKNFVDLSSRMPQVFDQGQFGTCTANAVSTALQFTKRLSHRPSRMFSYWAGRKQVGSQKSDVGVHISDALDGLNKRGWVPERAYRYLSENLNRRPDPKTFQNSAKRKGRISYSTPTQSEQVLENLLLSGKPVIAAIRVFPQIYGLRDEVLRLEKNLTSDSGHAVLITGFDDATKTFSFRNSWGTSWGNQGYGKVSYEFLLDGYSTYDLKVIDG